MLCISLWRCYINITIEILNIIHRPVFYLKHSVSEAGFCPRFQVEPTKLGKTDRDSLCLRTPATTPIAFQKTNTTQTNKES
jgi:hypothetical protein